jgi:hypothetical protein
MFLIFPGREFMVLIPVIDKKYLKTGDSISIEK